MKTVNQLEQPDQFYDELANAHKDLDLPASADLNARLVLILANQIGSQKVLSECIALALCVPESSV
ncbi:DUF2783 domain-containing protein [Advenella alkanexedens]|uniref:DUF2783 domain-containing protein n=1 Tax=Advenella alkanexedens TaxID=1481665 RepID=A0ABS6NQ11_9BURK|nr:DUF2783 domain-containing protein [Advenella alkanexedens]MBV4397730.1 DUF2783 domain-containing protein [Advenella alkanexedens]